MHSLQLVVCLRKGCNCYLGDLRCFSSFSISQRMYIQVSLTVHTDSDLPHPHLMAVTAIWGEFVYHDISHTPQMSGYLGQRLKCCGVTFDSFHPECYPIKIPENDVAYGDLGVKCQEYTRSGTASRTGCTLGPREQINQVSLLISAGFTYSRLPHILMALSSMEARKRSLRN